MRRSHESSKGELLHTPSPGTPTHITTKIDNAGEENMHTHLQQYNFSDPNFRSQKWEKPLGMLVKWYRLTCGLTRDLESLLFPYKTPHTHTKEDQHPALVGLRVMGKHTGEEVPWPAIAMYP